MTDTELRKIDAFVHVHVMGKRAQYIAAEPMVIEDRPDSLLGIVTNFGGAVFTASREWLVDDWYDPDANDEVPRYSTDPGSAWEVVEKMGESGLNRWVVVKFGECSAWFGGWASGEAPTMPLAVCRAALKAKGVQ